MSKGSRDRTQDHVAYGKTVDRIIREMKRKRKLADKQKEKKNED